MSVVKHKKTDGSVSWRVSVYSPLTQKTVWVGTFDEVHSARQAELDAEKQLKMGVAARPSENIKLQELIERWIDYTAKQGTREDYRRSSVFFIRFFGERRARSLRAEDYYDFARWLIGRRKPNGDPYSANYIRKIVTQLYQLTNLAVELGYLDRSPAPKIKRLNLPEASPRKVRLSKDQVRALVEAAPPGWADFFVLALATGARRGEMFSMTYGSVDWAAKTIAVSNQLTARGEFSSTKTAAAMRVIALPDGVLDAVRHRMEEAGAGDCRSHLPECTWRSDVIPELLSQSLDSDRQGGWS